MVTMWMVRAEGGRLYEDFRRLGVAALGWTTLAPLVHRAGSREALIDMYQAAEPMRRRSAIVSGASQVWRFAHELMPGHWTLTYSPRKRTYLVGRITGPARHRPEWMDLGLPLARPVDWCGTEVSRDALRPATRDSLAPTLTLFRVAPGAARQILLHFGP